MATKVKTSRLESEIEKCRVDANWSRSIELVKQLANKTPGLETLAQFIHGESKLEQYLKHHALNEKNTSKSKSQLSEAETYLTSVSDSKYRMQALLLLGKLHYSKGAYQTALSTYGKADLENITITNPSARVLCIIAEGFAIKGLCLEKSAPSSTSKYQAAEKDKKVLACFERAGDICILHLQEKEKNSQLGVSFTMGSGWGPGISEHLSPILEIAIQRAPQLYIKNGQIQKGIGQFRELLRAVETRETQIIRQTLARQLAEVLLRGVCEKNYVPLRLNEPPGSGKINHPKPKKYTGDRMFIPENENEEALLLLLIAEAVATREAVLNRSDELKEARIHTFNNTTAVYDLLTIALVKRAQFHILSESFERALRFSFDEFHIWHQFANSLISSGKHARSVLILKECIRLQPNNRVVPLQAAKLCYEYLHEYDNGIQFSLMAIADDDPHPLSSRAHVSLGIGYSLKAAEMKLQDDRHQLHRKALTAFQTAYNLDPSDYLCCFHLALQLAVLRQIEEAVKTVRLALKYRSDHIHSLHLLVLLLSAQKQQEEAMILLEAALEEYPENLSLLLTKSKLEELLYGPEVALETCKHMLKLWKDLHEIHTEDSDSTVRGPVTDRATFDRRSIAQLQLNEMSDRDTASIRAESIAASRVEYALSEVASSMNSSLQPRPGSQQTWVLQAQIWLHLAELYLSLDKVVQAEACVQETSTIFPMSHQVSYMRGRVAEHKQKYSDAKTCFENAVAINSGHIKSLLHLGLVLHHMDNDKMAEKVLRNAVNAEPTSHESWYFLGKILESLGEHSAATDCQITSLTLEASSPIVAFISIPRLL